MIMLWVSCIGICLAGGMWVYWLNPPIYPEEHNGPLEGDE